jgi:ribonuclease Z
MLSASKTRLSYPLMFHPLSDSGKEVICDSERLRVFSFPLKHSIPACGFLFTEKHASTVRARKERSYAYCSDTAYSREIAGYVKGADLLYHEATFLHEMETTAHEKMHSTALEAGMLAKEAGAVRLVIGHFSARYDDPEPLLREALTVFPDTVLAEDGKKIDICTQ